MEQDKQKLKTLSDSLIEVGGNAQELAFWEAIFDDLAPEEKQRLIENLQAELVTFQS